MNRIFLTLLAGIAIGLLLAPEKGSETLKKVINGLKNYGDDANQKAQDLIDQRKDAATKRENQI